MPNENTSLISKLKEGGAGHTATRPATNGAPAADTGSGFRTAHRSSSLRSNVFLIECVVVLGLYLGAIWWHFDSSFAAPQAVVLSSFGIMYMGRLNVMSRWLLKRELSMEELTFVILVWLPCIMGSYVFLARTETISTALLVSAVALNVFGSYLNTYSEYERMVWKQDPANKGHCYTLGLFSYSRNINYFGDSMLFTGWAMATGNWINAWAPITMSLMFYFMHIPDKEAYLATRYKDEWNAYKSSVKASFIPFVC